MKKTSYVLVLFILTFNSMFSQKASSKDYTYKTSEPYPAFDAKEKIYFAKGNEVMALKIYYKNASIQKFEADKPAFVKETKYEKYFPKNFFSEGAFEVDGKYYLFYTSWDGDNKKEQLFAVEIDFDKGKFAGVPKLVLQIDGKVERRAIMISAMTYIEDKFDFFQSNDKKNILVHYRRVPKVRKEAGSPGVISSVTFDGNLNKIVENEVTMPYVEKYGEKFDWQLDKKGNMYLISTVLDEFNNDNKKEVTKPHFHVELLVIKSGSDKVEVSKFDNEDKFINKLCLFDVNKDLPVFGGYYSNGKENNFMTSDGIVIFKRKEDGTIYDKSFHEIPSKILDEYESEKTKKQRENGEKEKDDTQFFHLEPRNLTLNEDGSIVFVGEQYFVDIKSTQKYTFVTYHYRDILISKINADGTLGWMKKIAKHQVGKKEKGGLSFRYFNANNNHYFVYLDNPKNIDLPLNLPPAKHFDDHGGYLTAVKISDADGKVTKATIFNATDMEDFNMSEFSTDRIIKTNENSFLLEVYKKKSEDILVKIELK